MHHICPQYRSIREQLGVGPENDQGIVVTEAMRQAREYLRAGMPFVWNATNVSRSIRRLGDMHQATRSVTIPHHFHQRHRIIYKVRG